MNNTRATVLAFAICLPMLALSAAADAAGSAEVVLMSAQDVSGHHLADARGMSLYVLDSPDMTSADPRCADECALLWTPVSAAAVRAGSGVNGALIGEVRRRDGTVQATYAGRPLYYFAEDGSGETNGQHFTEFGARGYLVTPAGAEQGGRVSGNVYARDEACGCAPGAASDAVALAKGSRRNRNGSDS